MIVGRGAAVKRRSDPRARLFRVARNAMTDRLRAAKPAEPIETHAETLPLKPLPV